MPIVFAQTIVECAEVRASSLTSRSRAQRTRPTTIRGTAAAAPGPVPAAASSAPLQRQPLARRPSELGLLYARSALTAGCRADRRRCGSACWSRAAGSSPQVSVPTVRIGPVSQNTIADPPNGRLPIEGIIWSRGHGERLARSAGWWARADRARLDLGGGVGHLVVPNATCMSTVWRGVFGSGSLVMWCA